ncbi:MAG: SDR family NAD(P)-dependent oxidoreductase [Actinomycetota bacterium]|nr:SDR family NAD(P)-dependent oxidoreductase [Actinomycetota bacterium]
MSPVAVVTGGGTGIGAAIATRLAADGFEVVVFGRRAEKLQEVATRVPGTRTMVLDVTDDAAVTEAAAQIGACDVLVNNAGGAFGADPVATGSADDWRSMFEVNTIGTLLVTQAFLPALRRSPGATVVNITSTAGLIAYEGGGGYAAAKHAASALTKTLRLELNGTQIRVVEVCPGMVRTDDFALTRFAGDQEKADKVYAGVDRPLVADDVAACVAFCVALPQHVNIDRLVVKPVAQSAQHKVWREPLPWDGTGD